MPVDTKFFLYARKSTDEEDRQVFSIEHQLAELRQVAARKNLEVVAELTENRSAMTPGRPVFNDMLTRIRNGEASAILAWHPDRLSRNSHDDHQIKTLVDDKTITHMEFAAFWFEATPQGSLMLDFAFGISKYYSAALSQNIQRANRQRIHAGFWPRRPPIGYLFDHTTRTIIIDPVNGPLVRRAFELYATGEYTLDRLKQVMTMAGLTSHHDKRSLGGPLPLSSYYHILHNPFYVSIIRYKGELFEAKHESLVTTKIFDDCQLILAQKGKYRTSTVKPFLYRGMFTCGECGSAITMEIQKRNTYLRCTKYKGPCSQSYLRIEDMAKQVDRILQKLALPQETIESSLSELEIQQHKEATSWNQEFKFTASQIEALDIKLRRLTEVYVDGTMPLSNFNLTKEKLLKQKRSYLEKLAFVQSHKKTPLEPAIRFIRGLTEARIVAEVGDATQKRDLLQKAASNLKLYNKQVSWTARGPWKYVAETARFVRRASRAAHASGSAHVTFSTRCTASSAPRLPEASSLFFKDNPVWV